MGMYQGLQDKEEVNQWKERRETPVQPSVPPVQPSVGNTVLPYDPLGVHPISAKLVKISPIQVPAWLPQGELQGAGVQWLPAWQAKAEVLCMPRVFALQG